MGAGEWGQENFVESWGRPVLQVDGWGDDAAGAAAGFDHLVGDAAQSARDVSVVQHGACDHSDLLPRLSGRNLKDV